MEDSREGGSHPGSLRASDPEIPGRPRRPWIALVLVSAALAYGVGAAVHRRWVCDDAFISYRYALNLVEGKGLVFNAGERVEGYSNFLWTLWCAVALVLRLPCEEWTMAWGIVFYALSLALLGYHFARVRGAAAAGFALPMAAVLGALHDDWTIYATSGLETSFFTFLAVLGYVLLAVGITGGRHRPVALGIVMALCALTRPDGVVFAAVAGALLIWLSWPNWRAPLSYTLAFGVPYAIFLAWRVAYYGDVLPNTYYAKSAHLAWWGQGWHYLALYLRKYGVLVLALPALAFCALGRPASAGGTERARVLRGLALAAAAFGGVYAACVTRVGGDFMFARMLIPATPFFLVLLELGLAALPGRHPLPRTLLAAAVALALVLPGFPVTRQMVVDGIANEWSYYGRSIATERQSAILRKYLGGLPVCVAFMGSEAHLMYRARVATAIESEAGLTDRFVAHLEIKDRGRVGHEKHAPLEYLIRQRKAHLTFHPLAPEILGFGDRIVKCRIALDGVPGYVLHWDPAIMAELARRGAKFDDLPARIDAWIGRLDRFGDDRVADLYSRLRLIYFDHVHDPAREAAFRARLGRGSTLRLVPSSR
jgi:hypothetical protein